MDLFRYSIECLVHSHTFFIMVMAETDTDDTIFFDEDGLVDMPARVKTMRVSQWVDYGAGETYWVIK